MNGSPVLHKSPLTRTMGPWRLPARLVPATTNRSHVEIMPFRTPSQAEPTHQASPPQHQDAGRDRSLDRARFIEGLTYAFQSMADGLMELPAPQIQTRILAEARFHGALFEQWVLCCFQQTRDHQGTTAAWRN